MELGAFSSCNLLGFIAHFFIMGMNICINELGIVNNKWQTFNAFDAHLSVGLYITL